MKVLITGANGFIGSALVHRLLKSKFQVRAAVRHYDRPQPGIGCSDVVVLRDLNSESDCRAALSGVEAVVHLAARVHSKNDSISDALAAYRHVNVAGTLNLAQQAAAVGVKRFLYISSIKVNGDQTRLDHPFTESNRPAPNDPYALSKWEAENGLRMLATETGLAVVYIRPPLVYGPGVKANFEKLLQLVRSGIPLPLGAIRNKRSFVGLDNLVDLLITCLKHPAADNQIFLAGDGQDLSTPELLKRIASVLGKQAFLVPVPVFFLKGVAALLGKEHVVNRLCGSLQVDISKARRVLEWIPPVSIDEGLRRTVADVAFNTQVTMRSSKP